MLYDLQDVAAGEKLVGGVCDSPGLKLLVLSNPSKGVCTDMSSDVYVLLFCKQER